MKRTLLKTFLKKNGFNFVNKHWSIDFDKIWLNIALRYPENTAFTKRQSKMVLRILYIQGNPLKLELICAVCSYFPKNILK